MFGLFEAPPKEELPRLAILDFEEVAKRRGLTGEKWLQFVLYERRKDGLQAVSVYPYTPAIEAYFKRSGIPIYKVPSSLNLPLEFMERGGLEVLSAGIIKVEKPIIPER